MSKSFSDKTDVFDDFEMVIPIPGITTDKIYCPNCGVAIKFTMRTNGKDHSYFCGKCTVKISEYWDRYRTEQLSIVQCKECQGSTFDECKHCINCGFICNENVRSDLSSIKKGHRFGRNMPLRAKQASYFLFGVGIVAVSIISLFEIINPNLEPYVIYLIIGIGGFSMIAGFGLVIFFSNTKYETSVKVKRKKFSFFMIFVFGISIFLAGGLWLIGFLLDRYFARCFGC